MTASDIAAPSLGVLLVHGVGFGPESMAPVQRVLRARATVRVVVRPGYEPGAAAASGRVSLDRQLDLLATEIERLSRRCRSVVLAGVSGGATLGLALALRDGRCADALVLHEPLVGPGAAALHERTAASAATLADDGNAEEFLQRLVGRRGWLALPPDLRAAAGGRSDTIRAEVPSFVAFEPTSEELGALTGAPIVTTVGSRSGGERRGAAELLVERAGAANVEVRATGHLVQVDGPAAWAACILGAGAAHTADPGRTVSA